jgi:drug/metabolite transporter (DMT)-like permease
MNKYLRYALLVFFFIATAARDVISKIMLEYLKPLRLSALTSIIAVFTCLIILQVQKKLQKNYRENDWNRAKVLRLFALSITTFFAVYLTNLSIQEVGPLTFKIIEVTTYPSWVALLTFFIMHQKVPKKDLIATAIALIGFFVFYAESFDQFQVQWLGIAASIMASFSFAASLLLAKWLLAHNLQPASLVAGRFTLLGLIAITASPIDLVHLPPNILWYLIGLGIISYAFMFTFMFYVIKGVPASTMSVFIAGTPIFSATLTWLLIPGTTYTGLEFLGLGIIVAGLLTVVFIDEKEPEKSPA